MKRTKAQRDQDREDLVLVLEEAGRPVMTGDLIATAYGVKEVVPGLPPYGQAMTDLRFLVRQGRLRQVQVDGYFGGYALADSPAADEQEDLDDVARQMWNWEDAS